MNLEARHFVRTIGAAVVRQSLGLLGLAVVACSSHPESYAGRYAVTGDFYGGAGTLFLQTDGSASMGAFNYTWSANRDSSELCIQLNGTPSGRANDSWKKYCGPVTRVNGRLVAHFDEPTAAQFTRMTR